MDFDAIVIIQEEIESGEKLIWAGRPKQGVRLRAFDAFMIPFGILWGSKDIQVNFLIMMFFALLLSACSSKSNYRSVAEHITKPDFKESSGFLKKWIRVDGEALENRTAQIDLESCVNKFSTSAYYQGDATTKTAKIFNCMYNFGWRIHIEEIWVTD